MQKEAIHILLLIYGPTMVGLFVAWCGEWKIPWGFPAGFLVGLAIVVLSWG